MNRPESSRNPAFSVRQARFVGARLAGKSHEEAAGAAGVSSRTAWRWAAREHVQAALRQGRDRILDDALSRALEGVGEALTVLRTIMADTDAPAASRVGAVRVLLETTLRLHEERELSGRVAALEAYNAAYEKMR